jgi:hypothetical protein
MLAGLVGWVGAMAQPAVTPAADVTCDGLLAATTVSHLWVPAGVTCNLNGTQVEATITVAAGAVLVARRVQVGGNIYAEEATQVSIMGGSTIGGSVYINQSGGATVLNSRIYGNLHFGHNHGEIVSHNNYIGGSLLAVGNQGGLRVQRNRIDGNLHCKGNHPAPTVNGNVVRGIKDEQCDGF